MSRSNADVGCNIASPFALVHFAKGCMISSDSRPEKTDICRHLIGQSVASWHQDCAFEENHVYAESSPELALQLMQDVPHGELLAEAFMSAIN